MAAETTRTVALLPIRPRYADAIVEGRKRVEFRRRPFGRAVELVVVYASSPVKKVVAILRVSEIAEGHPDEVWERFHTVGAIDRGAFQEYYRGTQRAVAIQFDRVCVLSDPVPLSAIDEGITAPQSYRYLTSAGFDRLNAAAAAGATSRKA
jgi:predicted transcriptional regulator